jgi:hypothetical protein
MHELTVTAFLIPEYPALFGEHLENIAYLHSNSLQTSLLPVRVQGVLSASLHEIHPA